MPNTTLQNLRDPPPLVQRLEGEPPVKVPAWEVMEILDQVRHLIYRHKFVFARKAYDMYLAGDMELDRNLDRLHKKSHAERCDLDHVHA